MIFRLIFKESLLKPEKCNRNIRSRPPAGIGIAIGIEGTVNLLNIAAKARNKTDQMAPNGIIDDAMMVPDGLGSKFYTNLDSV